MGNLNVAYSLVRRDEFNANRVYFLKFYAVIRVGECGMLQYMDESSFRFYAEISAVLEG